MSEQQVISLYIGCTLVIVAFLIFISFLIYNYRNKMHNHMAVRQQLLYQYALVRESDRMMAQVAKQLHDDILQQAVIVKMELATIHRKTTDEFISRSVANAEKAISTIYLNARQMMHALNTEYIKAAGIEKILDDELRQVKSDKNIDYEITSAGNLQSLSPDNRLVVFRIAQEAIQNIVRHSHATHVKVSLRQSDSNFEMRIEDNGAGFSQDKLHAKHSIGLNYMYERAKFLNGELKIDAGIDRGTSVLLTISGTDNQQ